MRKVDFKQEMQNKEVILCSKYGNTKAIFTNPLKETCLDLPFCYGGEYFIFNDKKFFVCEGEGELYYLDYTKELDFSALSLQDLDIFLMQHKEPQNTEKRLLLREFCKIDDINITKGKIYLNPKGYEFLANALYDLSIPHTEKISF